jgi:hypothetical protein
MVESATTMVATDAGRAKAAAKAEEDFYRTIAEPIVEVAMHAASAPPFPVESTTRATPTTHRSSMAKTRPSAQIVL